MRTNDEQNLLSACRYGQFDTIDALLRQGTSPHFSLIDYPQDGTQMNDYKTPLGEIMHHLYSEKHLQCVQAFLDAGVDVNGYTHHTVSGLRSTPLGRALIAHTHDSGMTRPEIQQQMVDLLLSRGADVTQVSEDDLAKFMERGEPALLESLLNAGLNPSTVAKDKTLLEHVIAAWTGAWGDNQAEKAKLLINRGADLSVKDFRGKTLAQQAQRPDIIKLLIEKDEHTLACMTLHNHVILESPHYTQTLIDRGDDINRLDHEGNTPLMQAAKVGQAEAAFVLMEAGANMNIHNLQGETALHLAMASAQSFGGDGYAQEKRFPILLELYSRGAIPSLDKKGRTPLMRCHVAPKDFSPVRFCIKEFSSFEASYYSFDPTAYENEMLRAYRDEMGRYEAFSHLPAQSHPKHLFTEKLTRTSQPVVMTPSREGAVQQAIKELLIALHSNNVTKARAVIQNFPEIDLNFITNNYGRRPLSIVIRSVTHSKDDCLPMLGLLVSNHMDVNLADCSPAKDTPLQACSDHGHYIDVRSMKFLLEQGANPNLANAKNETPLHKSAGTHSGRGHGVEEAITLLLQHGANPDALTNAGKKPIDMIPCPWVKTAIPDIFDAFQPTKGNQIDSALHFALCVKNRVIFVKALQNGVNIMIDAMPVPLSGLVEQVQSRQDLTPFSRNRLAFLSWLERHPSLLDAGALSENELKTVYKLTYSLYKADLDVISTIALRFAEYKDTKEMHGAAAKIQFWARKTLFQGAKPVDDHAQEAPNKNTMR